MREACKLYCILWLMQLEIDGTNEETRRMKERSKRKYEMTRRTRVHKRAKRLSRLLLLLLRYCYYRRDYFALLGILPVLLLFLSNASRAHLRLCVCVFVSSSVMSTRFPFLFVRCVTSPEGNFKVLGSHLSC